MLTHNNYYTFYANYIFCTLKSIHISFRSQPSVIGHPTRGRVLLEHVIVLKCQDPDNLIINSIGNHSANSPPLCYHMITQSQAFVDNINKL